MCVRVERGSIRDQVHTHITAHACGLHEPSIVCEQAAFDSAANVVAVPLVDQCLPLVYLAQVSATCGHKRSEVSET